MAQDELLLTPEQIGDKLDKDWDGLDQLSLVQYVQEFILAKAKQHYEQQVKEILEEIEKRWGWAFDKQVWRAFKQECLSGREK